MRIVSQNGKYDVPYDDCVVRMLGKHISAEFPQVNGGTTSFFLGEYSTEEKAQKVMKMMRGAYECSCYCDSAFDDAAKAQRPYLFMSNRVFQIPQNSEVGV